MSVAPFADTPPEPIAARHSPGREALAGRLGLGLVLALALSLRLHYCVGLQGSDDMATWQLGHVLAHGQLKPDRILQNEMASLRYGPALPVAVLIRVFGDSEGVVLAYPLAMSLLGIVAAWDLARRLTGRFLPAVFAALLTALASLDIHYSTVLLPDGPMAAIGLFAMWCIVVGLDATTGQRRQTAALAAGGALAWLAVMHKEAGLQVVLALLLFGGLMLLRRRLPRRLLMVGVGLSVACAAEHGLMYAAYGDPLHRWKVVRSDSANVAAMRRSMAGREIPVAERLRSFSRLFVENHPSFALLAAAGIVAAAASAGPMRRDDRLLLIGCYMVAVVAMRIPELTKTYSFQPRRAMPLAGAAAVVIAAAAARIRRPASLSWLMGGALIAGQSYALDKHDLDTTRADRKKLATERWLNDWVRTQGRELTRHPLYIDDRTYKVLYVLNGLRDLNAEGIHLLPSPTPTSHALFGPRPTAYAASGRFFDNPRYLDWLLPRNHADGWFAAIYPIIPPDWALLDIVHHPLSDAYNAALWRVGRDGFDLTASASGRRPPAPDGRTITLEFDGVDRPDRGLYGGWLVSTDNGAFDARMDRAPSGDELVLEFKRGESLEVVSDGGLTRVPEQRIDVRRHEAVLVRISIGVEAGTDASAGATCHVYGVSAAGQRTALHRRQTQLFYSRQELRAYCVAPSDLTGLKVRLSLKAPGRFRLGPIRVDFPAANGTSAEIATD